MPSVAAASYQDILDLVVRDVWTQYKAAQVLRDRLQSWKDAVFSTELNGQPMPRELQLLEPIALEGIGNLPTAAPAQNDFDTRIPIEVIKQITVGMRDNAATGANVAFETAIVAAFNANWV